ncbi:hypothetical protein DFA_09506 [Cavenderia fasciculata]|uniref:Uncharacterized protein n=1 Tax=Cavenderia fasciculata TaxID=261658 RepID=F4Q7T7_CACFS|nr:uncharacterized protein DFA_09506 [Cavenderia fasciculata]EGG15837.1 hypothetical protein DFA_09506 [Cavenderia fasciculata]|eukprot:XP_004352162.1 hypothetical protein DFA_09506 [Cavenderia fasciculata]
MERAEALAISHLLRNHQPRNNNNNINNQHQQNNTKNIIMNKVQTRNIIWRPPTRQHRVNFENWNGNSTPVGVSKNQEGGLILR